MNIRLGSTRLVILVNHCAFKIARIRPLRFFLRMFLLPISRDRRKHFYKKYGDNFLQAVLNDIFAGLYANQKEYEYYQTHRKDNRVMPSEKMFLHGFVVVQTRGSDVTESELKGNNPFVGTPKFCEMGESKQFCRHPDGRLVLVDYGRDAALQVLRQTA